MEIVISQIMKKYKGKEILKGIELQAASGECIGIVGKNGCGKSTFLGILAGTVIADGGSFLVDGKDILGNRNELARNVGFVPQENALFSELSALDNLLMWYDKKVINDSLESGVIKELGIGSYLNKRVSSMSGGMKKRVAIASAMLAQPGILLLDEATSALDLEGKSTILNYVKDYCKKGGIAILVTHDVSEMEMCSRLINISDGRVRDCKFDGDIAAFTNFIFEEGK